MTKDELEKESRDYALEWGDKTDGTYACCRDGYLAGAEPREKRIEELEKKISVLLSCANCSENKGGYICKKEYEDKCLAQKIQFIKELQQEIVELNKQIEKMKCCENCRWEEPSSFCDGCKRLKGQIFSDVITNDNWELRRYKNA